MEGADAVYPASASALARGRRVRRPEPRALRRKTTPVTFAEIKEVDEESGAGEAGEAREAGERRRRADVLKARPGAAAARRRRGVLRELSPARAAPAPAAGLVRAGSAPAALHRAPADT